MPVENERKYVLLLTDQCESECRKSASEIYQIDQGYLAGEGRTSVRIRRKVKEGCDPSYLLTVKHRINGTCWEIETPITQRDYEALWPNTTNRVVKTRCLLDKWEVDFFYNSRNERYFAMAEIEMPEGQVAPTSVPAFITDHLVYPVPRHDNRFSSRKISDHYYATKLLNEVLAKK